MRGQILEAVGQPAGQFGRLRADDEDVEELLFQRQIDLHIDMDGQTAKEVHPGQPEQPMPGLLLVLHCARPPEGMDCVSSILPRPPRFRQAGTKGRSARIRES
jgi:hypothetical protein